MQKAEQTECSVHPSSAWYVQCAKCQENILSTIERNTYEEALQDVKRRLKLLRMEFPIPEFKELRTGIHLCIMALDDLQGGR